MDGTETVALIRDLAFIALFVVVAVTAVVLGLKAVALARSIGRLLGTLREVRSNIASEMRPAAAATGIGVVGSLLRRIRGRGGSG